MGKRKAVSGADTPGKTRVELRFDTEVFEGIKGLADQAEISVNQLMHALAKWAVQKLKVGEPIRDDSGFIESVRFQPGCLWAGELGEHTTYSKEERRAFLEETGGAEPEPGATKKDPHQRGKTWIFIDYTERRVLRDDA